MIDENGLEMSEKQILTESMELMADVCALLFETESPQAIAAAYMADSLIKYLQVITRGDNVLLAAADYTGYEEKIYQEKMLAKKDNLRTI